MRIIFTDILGLQNIYIRINEYERLVNVDRHGNMHVSLTCNIIGVAKGQKNDKF